MKIEEMSDRMFAHFENQMKSCRLAFKARENAGKTRPISADLAMTGDFLFSNMEGEPGDSGELLLGRRKENRQERYLVKHAFTDCACNEFVYSKLALAMGYHMPGAVLIELSPGEKRKYFKTEYIIGETFLDISDPAPSFDKIREQAVNWREYYSFSALYAMMQESDGMEILLADDGHIYRVDTADAFLISNFQLDGLGVDIPSGEMSLHRNMEKQLLDMGMSQTLDTDLCDRLYRRFNEEGHTQWESFFLEPFERIQDISSVYIDDFLNTLCWIYPDCLGDFFKRYIARLQKQSKVYLSHRR